MIAAEDVVLGLWRALSRRDWDAVKTFLAEDCLYIDMPVPAMAIAKAKAACGVAISDVRYAAVYDSFTITLAMLLEDLGLARRGEARPRLPRRTVKCRACGDGQVARSALERGPRR